MLFLAICFCLGEPPLTNASGPYSPAEAVKHFDIPPGFKVTCVAHEPDVIDPVCMCFDAKGRIYVCEMPGYPNGGRAIGEENRGRVKRLEDRDGDGQFETVTIVADKLRFPTGIIAVDDGLIICNAPDIVHISDRGRKVLYTGFDLANIQQLPNSLQWGRDGKIYGMVAGTGGLITSPEKPTLLRVNLRGQAFRFDPKTPGSMEAISGGGQYGLAQNAHGDWFTCSNFQVCRQIVLPVELATNNPDYFPPAVTADIDIEGTTVKLFRRSPFETWRVERTTRRREGDDPKKYARAELVAGGYTSSTCGCVVSTAKQFPPAYRGSFFACDPGNNLILRRVLKQNGSLWQSSRPPEETSREFLASDDNWFRPVFLCQGPDGAIYVCDFYREIIETPLSIPDDMKARMNVESRSRGRIWRIAPSKDHSNEHTNDTLMSPVKNAEAGDDPWAQSKLLCELKGSKLIELLTTKSVSPSFAAKASVVIGRRGQNKEIDLVLKAIADGKLDPGALAGLGQGMKPGQLAKRLTTAPESLKGRFAIAAKSLDGPSIRLLAFAPFDLAGPALESLLTPATDALQQGEAVRALSQHDSNRVAEIIIRHWATVSPGTRKEMQEALMASPDRVQSLLAAIDAKTIRPGEIDPVRVQQLRNHRLAVIKTKALAIFGQVEKNRGQLIDDYLATMTKTPEITTSKELFKLHCASCHAFDGMGQAIGPNLLAAVPGKSIRELTTVILDPNREVDTRYLNYTIELRDGRTLSGIIVAENSNGITIKRADNGDEIIARNQIESMKSTGQSLMPEGLETSIPKERMLDLIEYLRAVK